MPCGKKGSSKYGVPKRLPNGKQNPAYDKARYEANKEHRLGQTKIWRKTHKSKRSSRQEYKRAVLNLIRQRDGDNCGICGLPVLLGQDCLDHILPKCRGGTEAVENLRLAHITCNTRRPRNE
jgi:5-methylcytosine-specific restriction endonuclease McrA